MNQFKREFNEEKEVNSLLVLAMYKHVFIFYFQTSNFLRISSNVYFYFYCLSTENFLDLK
jgi:hypothetical protein